LVVVVAVAVVEPVDIGIDFVVVHIEVVRIAGIAEEVAVAALVVVERVVSFEAVHS